MFLDTLPGGNQASLPYATGNERRARGDAGFRCSLPHLYLPLLLLLTLFLQPLAAADKSDASHLVERPRIGVVLGGGGARGAAHIGVLKILEDLRIPIDYIVGTSMGSIIAGLSATGMSSEEIRQIMMSMDWKDVFDDKPRRQDRSFRRKRDDDLYTFDATLGVRDGNIKVPLAVIRGQKFDLTLNRLTLPVSTVDSFDQLTIPFRAIATDLETGAEVVLDSGSLARAIRASMAVPAAFDPVVIDDRLLVDGGMVNNVPIDVARAMGADIVIAVNVSSPLLTRKNIENALQVSGQLAGFLTLNVQRQLETLGESDVLVTPDLEDISSGSFDRVADAISAGESAARDLGESLARYSLSPEQYAAHLQRRPQYSREAPVIDFIRIVNHSAVGDDIIAGRISAPLGEALNIERLEADIARVYGLEIFNTVNYQVVEEDGKTGLVVTASERYWGPGYIQGGIKAASNLQGDSTFSLGVIYTLTEINELNGEWRTGVQLIDEQGIFTEIYQPLDIQSRYFVTGKLFYASENINEFDSNGNKISANQIEGGGLELGVGREFGVWGEGRLGYRRATGEIEVNTGPPRPAYDADTGLFFARLVADKFDDLHFPKSGYIGKLEYSRSRESYGASSDYDQLLLGYSQALSWGRNTLTGTLAGGTTRDDNAPLEGLFQLGGFLLISGLQEDQLSGQNFGLARLVYYRRLSDDGLLSFFESYLGASLESGNVWQDSDDISFDDTITAGSVFVGFDTPVGPLYTGYGATDANEQSAFIYLGPRFAF